MNYFVWCFILRNKLQSAYPFVKDSATTNLSENSSKRQLIYRSVLQMTMANDAEKYLWPTVVW